MRVFTAALAVFVCLSMSCASIIHGGTQRVTLQSQPADADVKVFDARTGGMVASGKAPLSVSLDRGAGFFKGGKYRVVVEKAGYAPREAYIDSSLSTGWYIFGNILFGGLIGWFIVDPATGGMWSLDPELATYELSPQPPASSLLIVPIEDADRIPVMLSGTRVLIGGPPGPFSGGSH